MTKSPVTAGKLLLRVEYSDYTINNNHSRFFQESGESWQSGGVPVKSKINGTADELRQLNDPLFFRQILSQARDIVLIVRSDGKILYANRAAAAAYGYTEQELLALSVSDLRTPEMIPALQNQLKDAFTKGILFRSRHRRKNGQSFPVEVSSQKFKSIAIDAVVSIVRDITETIAIENALQHSEQKQQNLNEELIAANEELTAANEELTASEEELRTQFEQLMQKEAEIRRQNGILSSVQEMAVGLIHRRNPTELLSMIVADATRMVGTQHGFIYILDREKNVFRRTHGIGIYAKDIGREIAAHRGIVGLVRRTGKPAIINDYAAWKRNDPASVQFDEIHAVLQIPLLSEGRVVGTIGLAYCEPGKIFAEEDLATVTRFAEMASIAWDNATLLESYSHEIQDHALAETSLQAMINAIPDTIFLIHRDGTFLDFNAGNDFLNLPRDFFIGKNIARVLPPTIAATIRLHIDRALSTESLQLCEYQYAFRGKVEHYETRIVVSGKDQALVICRNVTVRKQMEEQLKHLSLHDSLTGCYNRTFFEEEMRRFEKQRDTQVALLMCDVDGLKIVNDSLGHDVGDEILKSVAAILRRSFRSGDIISRIGGDEFVILLGANSVKTCENACRKVKKQLADYNTQHPTLPISLSMGFAVNQQASVNMTALFKEADNNMYREKLHQTNSARSAIVQGLVKALEARDFITEGHGDRLQSLVETFARALDLPEHNMPDLRLLAHFHDIGKVGIPDNILFKPGPLTPDEWKIMRQHCEIGHRIAMSTPDLAPIANWILRHQEWWNGKGYPLGIKGEAIPLECRILSIVDAFDAMTSDRPYRKALDFSTAAAELHRCAGTQFDPQLVDEFTRLIVQH